MLHPEKIHKLDRQLVIVGFFENYFWVKTGKYFFPLIPPTEPLNYSRYESKVRMRDFMAYNFKAYELTGIFDPCIKLSGRSDTPIFVSHDFSSHNFETI